MKVFTEKSTTYPEDPARNFNFDRFNKSYDDFIFIAGAFEYKILENLVNKKVVFLELEDPNRFFAEDEEFNHIKYEKYFSKIFTICPYTAKWLNSKYNNSKRIFTFFPFNEELIPKKTDKLFDVVYSGHIIGDKLNEIVNTITKFNYRLISHSNNKHITDKSVNYNKKLEIVAQSKISIIKNSMELKDRQIIAINKIKGSENNYAFKNVPHNYKKTWLSRLLPRKTIEVPQIKSRVFEAAFCHTLILCEKDDFNVIEKFFKPNHEFIYYEKGELERKIKEILNDFEKYKPVIENAFQKARKEYTTRSFYDKYLKELKIN